MRFNRNHSTVGDLRVQRNVIVKKLYLNIHYCSVFTTGVYWKENKVQNKLEKTKNSQREEDSQKLHDSKLS